MNRRALHILAFAAVTVAGACALVLLRNVSPASPPSCAVLMLTGVDCPGCGMTRAMACLLHGELRGALRFHPLAPLLLAQALVAHAWWGLVIARRAAVPSAWLGIGVLGFDSLALFVTWLVRYITESLP